MNLASQDIDGQRFVVEHIKRPLRQYVVGLNLKGRTAYVPITFDYRLLVYFVEKDATIGLHQ